MTMELKQEDKEFASGQMQMMMTGLRKAAGGPLNAVIDESGEVDWTRAKALQIYENGVVALFAGGKTYISQPEHPSKEVGKSFQFAATVVLKMVGSNWTVAQQGGNIMFFDPDATWVKGSPPPFLRL